VDLDLEVEMELVYEWVADAEDDFLAEALEDAWFQRSEETLAELDDAPPRAPTLRGRMLRLIGFPRSAAA
jgi:hypothetical protein